MTTARRQKLGYWQLDLFLGFLALFICSRIFYISIFQDFDVHWRSENYLPVFAVGLGSDVWIAWLLACAMSPIRWFFSWAGRIGDMTFRGLTGLTALLLAVHVNYFAFYKNQFNISHIAYLGDLEFISANYGSAIDVRVLICLTVFYLTIKLVQMPKIKRGLSRISKEKRAFMGIIVTIVTLACHSANIHFRVQKNTPPPLAVNVFEHVYLNFKYSAFIPDFDNEDWRKIRARGDGEQALTTVSRSLEDITASKELKKLHQKIHAKLANKETVFVTVLLLESARYFDFTRDPSGETITPNFTALRATGVEFTRVYSTGRVTRGAQEAIWCAYPGNEYNSLMRQRPQVQHQCLPRCASKNAHFHWIHGGSFTFDQQGPFWTRQGVKNIISRSNFPVTASRTNWGVSDFELFKRAALHLTELKDRPGVIQNNMILTMTNHIPWQLPSDAPELIDNFPAQLVREFIASNPNSFTAGGVFESNKRRHPSHRTTNYTDAALGWFVAKLKEDHLWSNHLLILVGDHGIAAPFFSQAESASLEHQLTHVPLLLSGGIIENLDLEKRTFGHTLSQLSLATTLAYLNNASKMQVLSPDIFDDSRPLDVFSDLADVVYYPHIDRAVSRRLVSRGLADSPLNEALARIHSVEVNKHIRDYDSPRFVAEQKTNNKVGHRSANTLKIGANAHPRLPLPQR